MDFIKVTSFLSAPRIGRYLAATGSDQARADLLYRTNLEIAQAFHPLLGVLEVILRNQINTVLSSHFNDSNWIINQKTGFMADPSLKHRDYRTGKFIVNDFLKHSVEKSEMRFGRLRVPVTSGKIISDQSLGFWTDFFEVHHYKLLLGRPIKIFGHLASGNGRKEVSDRLTKIRQFRNRINHNEPICFNQNNIDFNYVVEIYNAIIEILQWIDPEICGWIKDIDVVNFKIAAAKNI